MFGASSRKPTTLLCFNIKAIALLRQTNKVCDGTHHHATVLRGLDENGLFRTSPAKQYPPGLCHILAQLAYGQFVDACTSPPPFPDLDQFASSVLSKFYIPTDPYQESTQTFGADFSSNSGGYASLSALPSAKAEEFESRLSAARVKAQNTLDKLAHSPLGTSVTNQHGLHRVHV